MTVNTGDDITAAQYEELRGKAARVLGEPSGSWSTGSIGTTAGYEQTPDAPIRLPSDLITAEDWNKLHSDLTRSYAHIVGSEPSISEVAADQLITAEIYNDYEAIADFNVTNRNTVAATQRSLASATTGILSTNWNGKQTHAFTMTWDDNNHKKGWINSGGTLRFNTSTDAGGSDPYLTAPVISVIDEDSRTSLSTLTNDWTTFRASYPNRNFYLLQPQTSGALRDGLKIPSNFASDPKAYGPIAVNEDNGSSSDASDWFTIANLGSLPSGRTVTYFVDNSGSLTKAKVQASINLLRQKCLAAGLNLVEFTDPNENWIAPFIGNVDPANQKNNSWRNLLDTVGVIEINNMSMTETGGGDLQISQAGPSFNGWWYLDGLSVGTEQTIYRANASGVGEYSDYSENYYEVKFIKRSNRQYEFQVIVNDVDDGNGGTDQNVETDITSTVQVFTASGQYVALARPTFAEKTPTNTFNYS